MAVHSFFHSGAQLLVVVACNLLCFPINLPYSIQSFDINASMDSRIILQISGKITDASDFHLDFAHVYPPSEF
uniref:Putative secreted protein n=1 Tax=Anopheles darlingi TaxID=43151 RepID=A0A2M4DBH8_ANODA